MTHAHPCQDCRTPVECHGELERNYDGFPETICTSYHERFGTVALVLCDGCHEAREREQDGDAA